MRNDKPRFSKCPWVDLAEIEERNDQATLLALSFPSSISARSTQRHLLNLGLLQDRLELQDLPKTYSPTSSGCLSFSRTVRSHSTCYGKAMKRTALNSDSGLGVTFQPKNVRFLGSRLGGMAKFASICPHVFLYDYVWVTLSNWVWVQTGWCATRIIKSTYGFEDHLTHPDVVNMANWAPKSYHDNENLQFHPGIHHDSSIFTFFTYCMFTFSLLHGFPVQISSETDPVSSRWQPVGVILRSMKLLRLALPSSKSQQNQQIGVYWVFN